MPHTLIKDLPTFWQPDGSLREVWITGTSLEDWVNFIRFIQDFQHQYSFDGKAQALWPIEQIFANRDGHHLLSINISGVFINCHFFIVEEIELDIAPHEITEPSQLEALLEFIAALAKALQRKAVLTPENEPDRPFLTFGTDGEFIQSLD